MKILQVGLGSMGKRRIRNLLSLGYKDITGFDLREDRRKESKSTYNIRNISNLKPNVLADTDTLIVSTPPLTNTWNIFALPSERESPFL